MDKKEYNEIKRKREVNAKREAIIDLLNDLSDSEIESIYSAAADFQRSKGYLTCEECGKVNDTVKTCIDPYDKEICEVERQVTICRECYINRAEAI